MAGEFRVDKHPKFKKSALEIILTTLHAGGKFSDKTTGQPAACTAWEAP